METARRNHSQRAAGEAGGWWLTRTSRAAQAAQRQVVALTNASGGDGAGGFPGSA